jgi:hypothetical protein
MASRLSAYAGTSPHRAASSGDTSRWNWRPYERRTRKAWCRYERVAVPLERRHAAGSVAEDRIRGGRLGQLDREHADLRLGAGVHARAERGGEELRAEAHAPHGHVPLDGLAEEALLAREPRVAVVPVRGHRAAHHDDADEVAPVGQAVALVQLDPHQVEAASAQLVLERCRRLAGDVLQRQQGRAHAETV